MEAVRVMMYPAQVYRLPAVVAQEKGIFEDHGLDVEFVSQPPTLQGTQGMQATKANVGQLSTSTLAQGSQSGADVAFFCGGLNVIQTSLVAEPSSDLPATADGASWEEVLQSLEGKKIGIQTPVGSGVQLLFAAALNEAGVEDVTYVNIGTDMKVAQASLGNGSIDVAQVTPPVLQTMVSDEAAKELLYLPDGPNAYKNNYGSAWTAPRSWLESAPDAAAAFCDAVTEGLEFIRDEKNHQEASALLQQDTGVPAGVADKVLEDGVYDDFSTALEQSQVATTLDMYADLGIVKAKPALDVARLVSEPTKS
jgi:ABC-type nitrate/sulfonate/bicarbonate transport system substrate-binding protein